MYEVFLKNWYQEVPNETQEEIMGTFDNIEDAFGFLKKNAAHYIEFYPLEEMGVRLKIKIIEPIDSVVKCTDCTACEQGVYVDNKCNNCGSDKLLTN